jgi:glycosyltransferase involved in cell wall biosynthesis
LRGGIETWLYETIKALQPEEFEHHLLVRTAKNESFTDAFKQAGVKVIPCLSYQNPIKYALNLRRIVRENGPYQILHVHGSNPNGLLALLLAKRLGISSTVVHSHNDLRPLLERRGAMYRLYVDSTLKVLRRFSDCGLAASARAAESMFGDSWQKDNRFRLLFYGIDFRPFAEPRDRRLRFELAIPADAFVVGHVGRYHEQKNHELLVDIAEEVIRRDSTTHFIFIGDGELRSTITSDIERRGLSNHVTFIPDTLSIARYMRSAMDCFVFPSRYEGLGRVAVEAQAAGLPCLLSDRVPRESIVDPDLVQVLRLEEGAEAWAEAILRTRNRTPVTDITTHLNLFNRSGFNLDRNTQILADLYRAMAARG